MANRPHQFKNRDITRCLRSALAAGVEAPVMTIRLPNGTEYVIGAAGGKAGEKADVGKARRGRASGVAGRSPTGASPSRTTR
jgi:hypothetical protein